jgi:predicted dehydrogenase
MAKSLRAAIVGCGAIAGGNDDRWIHGETQRPPFTHAGAYRNCSGVELTAAADPDSSRLERFARVWGIAGRYSDYKDMLRNEQIDILSICTPATLHAEVLREACLHGVPAVFCEKPLATELKDAHEVLQLCLKTRSVVAVNYFRRWNSTLREWIDRIVSGEFGRIRRINAYYTKGLVANGTHAIDLLLWLVGRIRAVRALRISSPHDADPSLDVLCLSQSDIPCYLQGCLQEDFNILEMDVFAERGRIRLAENGRRIEHYRCEQDLYYLQYRMLVPEPEVIPTSWQDCFSRAVQDLVSCLPGSDIPQCGPQEAYEALRVAIAARQSAMEGGREVIV